MVVDEEHDASYKQEGDPRYDARRVAERRAESAGAVLLCGSATPRPESVRALARLRLDARVDGRPLPPVEVLDMRDVQGALHPRAHQALEAVRRARHKAIVLLNRRGWSNFLSCRSCGRVWECPDCDVALILHRAEGTIACHHCGHRKRAPRRCDDCGSSSVARHGAGTERLEHELSEAFGDDPEFPVFRLDADTAAARGAAGTLLRRLRGVHGRRARGHADGGQGARLPRRHARPGARRRRHSALPRLPRRGADVRPGGAAGGTRGTRPAPAARVLVQTLAPEAPSIAHAARHDADGFLAGELARREALRYPPFADLVRIVCSSAQPGAALAAASAVRAELDLDGGAVLGPAPLFRLRGRERAQIVVKAGDRAAAVRAIGAGVDAVAADRAHKAVAFSVDVDPQ